MFLAKAVTIVVAIVAVIIVVLASTVKHKSDKGELRITNLSEELEELKHGLKEELLSKKQFKAYEKQLKADEKAKDKAADEACTGKVFVIDFKGSIDAAEVASLREEISAIIIHPNIGIGDNKKLNKNVETKNNKHAPTAFSHLPLNNSLAFSLHSTLSVTK